MMKKYLILLLVMLPLKAIDAEITSLDRKSLNEVSDYLKDQTIESCYAQTVSAIIQACLINLALEKKDVYETTFNTFIKDITAIRTHFMDFNLFVNLMKKIS